MKKYKNALCIAGTHGKTTTTSMSTHILMAAQRDPTVMIGGTLPLLNAGHRVGKGDTIILDASSTAWHLTRLLPDVPMVVLTNSSQVAVSLARHKHVKVIVSGGILSPASLSFVGPLAEETLSRYHADKAFLSCRAADVAHGVSDANELQAMVRRCMLKISDRHILMVDHSKLDRRALATIAPLSDFHEVITDGQTTPAQRAALATKVGKVTVVETPQ